MQVRNEKARRFLVNMRKKNGVQLESYFSKADRGALRLLKRMLAFDPAERPTSEEALADPYFNGLGAPVREPSASPVSRMAFDFERHKLQTHEVRLECHDLPCRDSLLAKAALLWAVSESGSLAVDLCLARGRSLSMLHCPHCLMLAVFCSSSISLHLNIPLIGQL